MTTTLSARLHIPSRQLHLKTVAVPEPGPGQVLVKVGAAGVCLSDLHLLDRTLTPVYLRGDEVTLGHEVAGTIETVGSGVSGWKPGQRVLLHAGEEDRHGRVFTRGVDFDGGWAEYALATATTLVPVPDDLSFEQACIIPDAVSTPWAAISTTAQVHAGDPVGVWGVGGLGAHAVQLLRIIGAAPVVAVDPLPEARARALALGADLALDPTQQDFAEQVHLATDGAGLGAAFDFAGVPAVRAQALQVLGRRGRLVLVGLSHTPVTIDDDVWFSYLQQQVLGAYGSERHHVEQLVRLARTGRLDLSGSVSAVLPLRDVHDAVARLQSRAGNPIRLALVP
jgi:D-arabinose 1-dehydrogenase-like Zn-dependent alcohol dehydrogenase